MNIIGKVEAIHGETGHVTLYFVETNQRIETECSSSLLIENGIGVGSEFEVVLVEKDGTTVTNLVYLPPKELTKEEVRKTREQYEDRWNNL